jgi:hypothetical protein
MAPSVTIEAECHSNLFLSDVHAADSNKRPRETVRANRPAAYQRSSTYGQFDNNDVDNHGLEGLEPSFLQSALNP